jgi:GUN4-like
MDVFKKWILLRGQSIFYLIYAALFSFLALWSSSLDYLPGPIKFFIGLIGLSLACRFFILANKVSNSILSSLPGNQESKVNERLVEILSSGTYNESISVKGDYVQGDKHINVFKNFNFNQEPIEAIEEIQRILNNLSQTIISRNFVRQKITDDLIKLSREDKHLKERLNQWEVFFGFAKSDDIVDSAKKIISLIKSDTSKSFFEKYIDIEKSKERYQRLTYLLRTSQWREGDEETVRIIKNLMPEITTMNGCTDIDVMQISPKQIKAINEIWLESSGGRFGFSVQKKIWAKINRVYEENRIIGDKSVYDIFTEYVGWSNDMGLIYHIDFEYEITSPKGYLPAKILLLETYDFKSNYCRLSNCLFDYFMQREYSGLSFIPDWLRKWLVLD